MEMIALSLLGKFAHSYESFKKFPTDTALGVTFEFEVGNSGCVSF